MKDCRFCWGTVLERGGRRFADAGVRFDLKNDGTSLTVDCDLFCGRSEKSGERSNAAPFDDFEGVPARFARKVEPTILKFEDAVRRDKDAPRQSASISLKIFRGDDRPKVGRRGERAILESPLSDAAFPLCVFNPDASVRR